MYFALELTGEFWAPTIVARRRSHVNRQLGRLGKKKTNDQRSRSLAQRGQDTAAKSTVYVAIL